MANSTTSTMFPIPPHGGALVNRVLRGVIREAAIERAEALYRVQLSP